jgi:selenocysteine lyase/cysteine desulfurase
VTFNVFDAAGDFVDHALIERLAAARGISLRTGCFCNPGAGEVALGLTKGEIETCFSGSGEQLTLEEFRGCIDPQKGTGAVRVSLGMVSTLEDVEAFIAFARGLAA